MMKRIAFTAFALLGVARIASADPITLPTDEPLFVKFNNIELIQPCTGATPDTCSNTLVAPAGTTYQPFLDAGTMGNWGLVVISTIQLGDQVNNFEPHENFASDDSVANLFTNTPGAGGAQITGIFYDISLTSNNTATGGRLDIFWQEGTSLSIGSSTPTAASVNAFTSGVFLASIIFEPGIMPRVVPGSTDCSTTVFSEAGVNANSGFADSYAEVDTGFTVGGNTGEWANELDGNWFNNDCPIGVGSTSDLRFRNSFNRLESGSWAAAAASLGAVAVDSTDPVKGFTAGVGVVPEPATLTLLGLGLAGLGYRRRKKTA